MKIQVAGLSFDIEFDYATDTGVDATVYRAGSDEIFTSVPSHWESEIYEGIAEALEENGEISEDGYRTAIEAFH